MRIERSKKLLGRMFAVTRLLMRLFHMKGRRKMILEQNVPAPIRTWAACQVKIRHGERAIRILEAGEPVDFRGFAAMKALGRARYRAECCTPEIARLKRCCARYRVLAGRLRRMAGITPETRLLSKSEALDLIGSTLHYRVRGRDVYDTLLRCSEDGERIFSSIYDSPGGTVVSATSVTRIGGKWLDAMSLLSLGFGNAPQ